MQSNIPVILGIDEVGRGPWAGPLMVGAVILGEEFKKLPEYEELKDSKLLSPKKRERLSEVIFNQAECWGLGYVGIKELNKFGLAQGLRMAAWRAVQMVRKKGGTYDQIIIDGKVNLLSHSLCGKKAVAVPRADMTVKEVSAASIIAKVTRDNYMKKLSEKYPEYGFQKHMGYGTKQHQEALARYGITPEHRTFVKPVAIVTYGIREEKAKINEGKKAEIIVSRYLRAEGHRILGEGVKHKSYEIDIISLIGKQIYFTEVKYSKDLDWDPKERVTNKKKQQMRYAAEKYLEGHQQYAKYEPRLAVAGVTGKDFTIDWMEIE